VSTFLGIVLAASRSMEEAVPEGAPEDAEHKTCPECKEMVLAAAKVCRYYGYRFDQPPDSETPVTAP
jgi:hypothetical protein